MYSMSFKYENNLIQVHYNRHSISILNSYKIKRKRDMRFILTLIECASFNRGIFYSRNQSSWIRDWKAHNVLYKLGIKNSKTKHITLNEKKSLLKRFGYFILSLFCWK